MKKHARKKKLGKINKKLIHNQSDEALEERLLVYIDEYPNDYNTRYQLAQYYSNVNQPEKAIEVGLPLKDQVTSKDKNSFLDLYRLLVFSYISVNNLSEAENCIAYGLPKCTDSLDFYFAAAIVSARKSKYESSIKFAEKYLELWQEKNDDKNKINPWDNTIKMRYQLLSAYGAALNELSQTDKAEKILHESIDDCSEFESSYINLVQLLKSQNRNDEAIGVIKQGLKACPQSKKLRKMVDWSGNRPTISACMIVKNEEEFLPRCLNSIHDVVDEIILVDTGSEDRTQEIAKEFGCKIYHYPWQGDFSSARNESMKYATKDWIFVIDADEELPPEEIPQLRMVTNQEEFDVISISVINKSLETGQVTSFLPSVRLIKRNLNLQYFGIVHNRLDIPNTVMPLRSEINLYHYGYDISRDKLDAKLDRSQKLLKKQLDEKPNDVYANFNMAQLLRGYKNSSSPEISERIVNHASRAIENPESMQPNYFGHRMMAFYQKAIGLCGLDRFEEAEECCKEAIKGKPDYLDPILSLGDIYNYLERFDESREYYYKYLDFQKKYSAGLEIDNIILHNLEARHKAWFGIGLIEERLNNADEAIYAYKRVLTNKDPYLDTSLRLGKIYLDNEMLDKAEELFRGEIEKEEVSSLAFFGLGCALANQDRIVESLGYIKKSIESDERDAGRILFYGQLLIKLGRIDEGRNYILEAVEQGGDTLKVVFEAGDTLFKIGEMEEAIECYNKTLAIKPDHIEALNNLGNCYFKTESFPDACSIYEQVIKNNPEYSLTYRNLGLAYYKSGDNVKALKVLMEYSNKTPEDIEIYNVIGNLFVAIEQYPEALGCFEKYLIKYPTDYNSLIVISDIYLKMGHAESARVGYEQALKIQPLNRTAQERLALISVETPVQ